MGVQEDLFDAINRFCEDGVKASLEAGANPSLGCSSCYEKSLLEFTVEKWCHPGHEQLRIFQMLVSQKVVSQEVLLKTKAIISEKKLQRENKGRVTLGSWERLEKINEAAIGHTATAGAPKVVVSTPRVSLPTSTVRGWKRLLFSEKYSDITFAFVDGSILHAHKNVLAMASPYFDAYFDGPWGNNHPDGVWETQNSLPVMKAILSFIYVGDLTMLGEVLLRKDTDLGEVLAIVDQYDLPLLKKFVVKHMEVSLSLSNLKESLCIAHQHGLQTVIAACFDMISRNNTEVIWGEYPITDIEHEYPALWKDIGHTIWRAMAK